MTTVTTITIKRPEGHVEVVDVSEKFFGMTDGLFERVKKSTKEAGKGECISYEVTRGMSADKLLEIKKADDKARWFAKHGFNPSDVS